MQQTGFPNRSSESQSESTIANNSSIQEEKPSSPAPASSDESGYITGLSLASTLSSLVLVVFLVLLDTSIVSTAIPRITTTFHSLNDVGWYGTAYLVANCAVQPLSGKMYTYFNSKWTFIAFFTIFELGSAICGAAQSSNMLIVGRALAGIGSSGLFNGAFTILNASVPTTRLGGFYVNLPCIAVIYLGLIAVAILDSRTTKAISQDLTISLRKLDFPGFILFAGRIIWASYLNYAFLFRSMIGYTYYLPIYFQAVRGASLTISSINLLPMIVLTMVFAIVYITKIGYYLSFALASSVIIVTGSALLITLTPNTVTCNWIGFQIIQGIGRGIGMQIPLLAVQIFASKGQYFIITGLVVLSQNLGSAVFLAIYQVVFSSEAVALSRA
ncbi:major facilitator superfamily domain-containing protein [Aspergillus undulatus]|uniref:major facilitator superfamily domain-containing protein n=1 Tax=Aspergillus undulatus TaxID=1810928 RepID=UPI003CCD4CB8